MTAYFKFSMVVARTVADIGFPLPSPLLCERPQNQPQWGYGIFELAMEAGAH
jgi:hypothetical protein